MKPRYIVIAACAALLLSVATAFYYFVRLDTSYIKATVADRLERALGRRVDIDGKLDISFKFPVSVSLHDVKVKNAAWGTTPHVIEVQQLDARLRFIPLLLGNIDIDGLVLSKANIYLETSKTGKWNVDFHSADNWKSPPAGESDFSGPPIDRIRIDHGVLIYRSSRSDERQRVEIEHLFIDIGQGDEQTDIKSEGIYKKLPFSVAGSVKPGVALFDAKKKMLVSADVGIGDNSIALDGSINRVGSTPVIEVDVDIKADKPSELKQIVTVPGTPAASIQATGHLKSTGGSTFRFSNLDARIGRNHIAGNLALEMGNGPINVKADLTSSYLDLSDFIRRPKEKENKSRQAPAEQNSSRLFSNRPLELAFLDHFQGTVQFDAEKLVLPFLMTADAKISFELKNRLLKLDPLEAQIDGGGTLTGELHLAADEKLPRVETNLRIKHLNLGALLDTLEAEKVVKGNMGLDLDVHGKGNSIRDIMGTLDGEILMVLQNGQIAAGYLKKAERLNLDLTDTFLKLFEFTQKRKDFAEINCFVSKFVVKKGLADCRVLVFDTERIGVLGDGKIDLKTEQLHMSLKPIKKGGIGLGGIGRIGADVGPLPDNFNVGGTLSHPVVSVDKSKTAVSTLLTLGKAIGGTVLLGPAGLAAALVDLDIGAENPCVAALKEAASEEAAAESKKD